MSDFPKSRMPLRYRAMYSTRASVYRHGGLFPWRAVVPGLDTPIEYTTHDEAVHDAHLLTQVAFERDRDAYKQMAEENEADYSAAEHPPVDQVRALLQAAWA